MRIQSKNTQKGGKTGVPSRVWVLVLHLIGGEVGASFIRPITGRGTAKPMKSWLLSIENCSKPETKMITLLSEAIVCRPVSPITRKTNHRGCSKYCPSISVGI